ncbi:MAG TPA: thioredoxin domain-containing protein [Polyangiaceae bacterium]|nr:thioredoxin domain-containing protein [Polyangiaceae bacterium]
MRLAPLVVALLLAVGGCRQKPASAPPATAPSARAEASLPVEPALALAHGDDSNAAVPVYAEDASWGSANAPVTIVAVLDLQCPFCARAEATLTTLREHYGPTRLRVVVKHNPLPFHPYAMPAALAAVAVQRASGNDAFFRFVDLVLAHQSELGVEQLARWTADEVKGKPVPAAALTPAAQIGRDVGFAREVGATGTPTFFVNGGKIVGAQPYEAFAAKIDQELAAVEADQRAGKSPSYSSRVAANFAAADAPERDADDGKIWKIPVDGSPALGEPDALVTIVEFSDYQCPYCKRVQPTLAALRQKYGADLRIVWKHSPLPFHDEARPAARLGVEAFRQKGNTAFWAVSEYLFAKQTEGFATAELLDIARKVGLDEAAARRAIETTVRDPDLAADEDLAADFDIRGTPNFFVNGRKIEGALPLEVFVSAVDDALSVARELVKKGIPRDRIYQTILDVADGPPAPVRVDVGPLPADRPSRGAKNAPVVIQEFSDFQCPFCARVQPTLEALQKEYPRDVRLVFRNLPLAFHAHARHAANAALEAKKLGGDAAFWKFHDAVFSHQAALSPADLGAVARTLGLDGARITKAAETGAHDAQIREDEAAAERATIHGTPGFVVNGVVVTGAQPIAVFERAVRRALKEAAPSVGVGVATAAAGAPKPPAAATAPAAIRR